MTDNQNMDLTHNHTMILIAASVYAVMVFVAVIIEERFNYDHIRRHSEEWKDFPYVSCIFFPIYWCYIVYKAGWGKLPSIHFGTPITTIEYVAKKVFRRKIYRIKDTAHDTCYGCAALRACCNEGRCWRVPNGWHRPHVVTETIEI